MAKTSRASQVLKKVREAEDMEIETNTDPEGGEGEEVSVADMEPAEIIEYIKNENWSQDPEKIDQVLEGLKKIKESEDEDAKLIFEALDDASTEFDAEVIKEKKKNKK